MQQKLSLILAVTLFACSTQVFALEIVNETQSKIEAQFVDSESDEKGYAVSIDGKPSVFALILLVVQLGGMPANELSNFAATSPVLPDGVEKVVFRYSTNCPGFESEKLIEARMTFEGEEDSFCFSPMGEGENVFLYLAHDPVSAQ